MPYPLPTSYGSVRPVPVGKTDRPRQEKKNQRQKDKILLPDYFKAEERLCAFFFARIT
jgi:hypothetical protein